MSTLLFNNCFIAKTFLKAIVFFLICLNFSLSANAAVTYIDIWEYRVEGNTLLDKEVIQRRLQRFLGVARTLKDVEQAVEELTQEYRNAGYPAVFVDIPPQTVVNGIFKLRVTETRLRRLKVSDATYFLPSSIKKAIPSLERGLAINLPELQNDIQKINTANPNLKVIPVLKQGPTPDTVDVELSIADEFPLTGGIEINNYSSANTSDSRLIADIGYSNLWQKNHTASLTFQTAPENTEEVKVFSFSYLMPGKNRDNKWAFYGIDSNSETATVGDISVVGEGLMLGGRFVSPLSQTPGNIKTLIVGSDYKDFEEKVQGINTPIGYLTFTAQLSQVKRTKTWYDSLSLALTFGMRGISNELDEFNSKRSSSTASFLILKAEYERNYPIWTDYLFTHRLKMQIVDTPLVSNEQITAGGVSSVRGYYESQFSGDHGLITGIEFSRQLFKEAAYVKNFRLSMFLEGAVLAKKDSGIDEDASVSAASVGLGLKARFFKKWKLEMDSAFPLEKVKDLSVENDDQGRKIKHHLSLKYEF